MLSYTRTGPFEGRPTIVVVPGGPGLASIGGYARLRSWAAASQVDLVMVEHRGVGFSRRGADGQDLTEEDLWIPLVVDDLGAVLDAEKISTAVLYGSSYGTYLVQGLAVEHPGRVSGLILDSAMLGAQDHEEVRAAARRLLWAGVPGETARSAEELQALVASGAVSQKDAEGVAQVVYEFCGPVVLQRLLQQVREGRGDFAWRRIAALLDGDTEKVRPFLSEFDLVGTIAFRELNFAPESDGDVFDPGVAFARAAARFPAFQGEPYDLSAALPDFEMPVVVLSGDRDLRTPREVAEQIAALAAKGRLIAVPDAGHSLLDSNQAVAREVLLAVSQQGVEAVPQVRGRRALVSVASYVSALRAISWVMSSPVLRFAGRRAQVPGRPA